MGRLGLFRVDIDFKSISIEGLYLDISRGFRSSVILIRPRCFSQTGEGILGIEGSKLPAIDQPARFRLGIQRVMNALAQVVDAASGLKKLPFVKQQAGFHKEAAPRHIIELAGAGRSSFPSAPP